MTLRSAAPQRRFDPKRWSQRARRLGYSLTLTYIVDDVTGDFSPRSVLVGEPDAHEHPWNPKVGARRTALMSEINLGRKRDRENRWARVADQLPFDGAIRVYRKPVDAPAALPLAAD